MIGTRYHYNDTWAAIMLRGSATPRIYPATHDGTVDGEPVLLSREVLAEKRRDQGAYVYSCQMLQNPKADETQGFKRDWLRYIKPSDGEGMNKYILVDAASGKRKTNDYTVAWVIGLASDGNYYPLEVVRDRLNLTQRGELIMRLHRKWKPIETRYEKYGLMADIEHIKTLQDRDNYHFDIIEVAGKVEKNDRIKRLIPTFEQSKWYFPHSMYYTNYEGTTEDLIGIFVEQEYMAFPVPVHDDMLDSLARLFEPDLPLIWPMAYEEPERYNSKYSKQSGRRSHMAA
jgi:predicted phage terminase large subunit-like protein